MQIVFPSYISRSCIDLVIREAMKTYFMEAHNSGKFNKLDNFLYNILGSNIRSIDILLYATNNAYVGKYNKQYVLDMEDNKPYKDTNYTLSSLIMLINSGNLEVQGTNIVVYCFNHIRHYLDILYDIYNDKYRRE